jgi:serine/threonine protein kinase
MNPPVLTAKAVFDQAHEIESAEERQAYLDQVCAGAPELRQKVEALLRAYEEAGSFMQKPAYGDATADFPSDGNTPNATPPAAAPGPQSAVTQAPTATVTSATGPGTQVGPYRLVKVLGEGGMGAVYLAEQDKPIRRQVALKLIKPGMDSAHVIARFEAERQALTMMDHPSIARVYDAGAIPGVKSQASGVRGQDEGASGSPLTPDSCLLTPDQPYFVMELVQGVPLTRFCNEQQLSVRERLALFVTVCQAIQHAHQKGIMHRDIKPSNVLVALQDGKPVAKVIDFGLAKATEQPLTEQTQLTQAGAILGTLKYMSPEQADFNTAGLDTRTDVYSLGVMLYELLTGTTPLDTGGNRGDGLLELVLRIKEEDAPRPSVRVAALGNDLPIIAARRRTDPARLPKLLRGELDWIALKAVEKDRDRRYQTASDLAKDIERYLADEPVEACPPSTRYRLGKVVRRYRGLVATVAVLILMLVLGLIGATWAYVTVDRAWYAEQQQHQRAVRAEKTTRASLEFNDNILQVIGKNRPSLGDRESALVRQRIKEYEALLPDTADSPADRANLADMQRRVANSYAFIKQEMDAERAYRKAINLYEPLVQEFPDDLTYLHECAIANFNLGILLQQRNKLDEAEGSYRRAISLHDRLIERCPTEKEYQRDLVDDLNNLGTLYRDQGKLPEAEAMFRRVIKFREQDTESPVDHFLAMSYHNLGNAVRDQDNAGTALTWYDKAVDSLLKITPKTADATAVLRNVCWDRAHAFERLKEYGKAVKDWQRAIALDTGAARKNLGALLRAAEIEVKLGTASAPGGELLYQAAIVHARAATAAKDENESLLQDLHANRALALLDQARLAGQFNDAKRVQHLREEHAFDILPRQEFTRFLDRLTPGGSSDSAPR